MNWGNLYSHTKLFLKSVKREFNSPLTPVNYLGTLSKKSLEDYQSGGAKKQKRKTHKHKTHKRKIHKRKTHKKTKTRKKKHH
jgi:hypothetical protein